METILQILQWAIPSGGIGAAIAWLVRRKAMAAKTAKEVHDTYKAMYEDISNLLLETQKKNEQTIGELQEELERARNESAKIKRSLDRLSRSIEAIQTCPHRANCPIRDELQVYEASSIVIAGVKSRRGKGQRNCDGNRDKKPSRGTGYGDADTDGTADKDTAAESDIPPEGRACDGNGGTPG